MEEDYRAIWREFYCVALSTVIGHAGDSSLQYSEPRRRYIELATKIADQSMKNYLSKRNELRELNLKAFK